MLDSRRDLLSSPGDAEDRQLPCGTRILLRCAWFFSMVLRRSFSVPRFYEPPRRNLVFSADSTERMPLSEGILLSPK